LNLDKESEHTWGFSWVFEGEHPPPSSIVSRRDTAEARKLARVADITVEQEESKLSGNRLWSVLTNFLTTQPHHKEKEEDDEEEQGEDSEEAEHPPEGENKDMGKASKTHGLLKRFKSIGSRT